MISSRRFWLLLSLTALCVVACSFLIQQSDLQRHHLLILFDRAALTQFFQNAGYGSVLLFLLAHTVANAVGVPGTLLVIVGGAVYGLWWGTLWSVLGATLGAIAAFCLSRYLLHNWFNQRFQHRPIFKKLNTMLCDTPLGCVLTIRFSPISPFNVVNFAFGLTKVPLPAYSLGTLLGIIPGTLAYTWLGVTGAEAMSSGRLGPLFACLTLLMLLSAVPLLLKRYQPSP